MDWSTIIIALINCGAAIGVAILARNVKKRNQDDDEREKMRREETLVSLQMIESTMDLSMACCNALCGGHNNGNVEDARKKAEAATAAYNQFKTKAVSEVVR